MNVLIFGAGKQAELMYYFFKHDSPHNLVAFCVENEYFDPAKPTLFDLPVIRIDEALKAYSSDNYQFHIAIGEIKAREIIYTSLKSKGYSFVNYVGSSSKTWKDLELGENVLISQACSIQPFVKIGNNSMVVGSLIGHHTTIGNNVLLSCVSIGGSVSIGDNTFVGLNSAIKEHVKIGKNNIIGAGCVILKDTEDDSVYTNDGTRKRDISATRLNLFGGAR